jgi:hypothetical protein
MTTKYEKLINKIKLKLKPKNINFNEIFNLINNKKYDEIIEKINNDTIHDLINNMINERERIGRNIELKLNNLLWLNDKLIQFGEEPQISKTKALHVLRTKVFINIYDLDADLYEKQRTLPALLIKDYYKYI